MKKSRKRKAAAGQPKGRGRSFIVTALALTLIAASVILGQRTQKKKPAQSDE